MNWFGEPWPSPEFRAPVCEDDALRVPTPAAEICMLCRQPVKPDDRGVVMPHIASDGWTERHYNHIECLIRNVTGGPMANELRVPGKDGR